MRATVLLRGLCAGTAILILIFSLKSWLAFVLEGALNAGSLSGPQDTTLPYRPLDTHQAKEMEASGKRIQRRLKQKVVHLDLKGMPPRMSYLEQLFPIFQDLGVTGLLVEYEDMFPYSAQLASIASPTAYTPLQIAQLNHLAKQYNLNVIPLIQTFGHLEFVLKGAEHADLREVERYPQVLCPSDNRSLPLLEAMIEQVLSLHPEVTHLHIGSDEVYYLGLCSRCVQRMSQMPGRTADYPKADLFLGHVKAVAELVTTKYHKRVMMWDDEFRQLDEYVIRKSGLGSLVEIVVWNYGPDVDVALDSSLWRKYSDLFPSVWIGSAFKGANRPDSLVVDESHYLANHFAWIRTLLREDIELEGIILTGWQRYDHFSVLCEILAVALPSLVASLTLLQRPLDTLDKVMESTSAYFKCEASMRHCTFPGASLYDQVHRLQQCKLEMETVRNESRFRGWAHATVNLQSGFSSPSHIEPILSVLERLELELGVLRKSLEKGLVQLYPSWAVTEWLLTHFAPMASEVESLAGAMRRILQSKTFPHRPLPGQSAKESPQQNLPP